MMPTTFRGRRWSRVSHAGWTVSLTLAEGLASVVWGGKSEDIVMIPVVVTLLVAAALLWLSLVGGRDLTGV